MASFGCAKVLVLRHNLWPNLTTGLSPATSYRWFYSFQCTFEAEKYLLCITNKWLRDRLVRFRLRVCGLKNHKQWFTTEQGEDLTCPVCGQESEDEAHFIFHCKTFIDLRKKYKIFDSPTTHCSMNYVSARLASKNETEITTLAKFITEAMKIRKKKIENN